MRVLVTGFEPFGTDTINASEQVLSRLPARLGGKQISTVTLPVSFTRAPDELAAAVAIHTPQLLICLGEAGGRTGITPEALGRNWDQARIADNDGNQPTGSILDTGPTLLNATIDPQRVLAALADFPAAISTDAGGFLCNHLAYRAYSGPVPAIFIHLPAVRPAHQVATVGAETDAVAPVTSSLSISDLSRAITAVLAAL